MDNIDPCPQLPAIPKCWQQTINRQLLHSNDKGAEVANNRRMLLTKWHGPLNLLNAKEISLIRELKATFDFKKVTSVLGLTNAGADDLQSWLRAISSDTLLQDNTAELRMLLTLELVWILTPLTTVFESRSRQFRSFDESVAIKLSHTYKAWGLHLLAAEFRRTLIGVSDREWRFTKKTCEKVSAYLGHGLPSREKLDMVYELSYSVAFIREKGPPISMKLIEVALNLQESDEDKWPARLARAAETLDNAPALLDVHGKLVWQLAKCLTAISPSTKNARRILEAWLQIDPAWYQDGSSFQHFLTNGRASRVSKWTRSNLISHLLAMYATNGLLRIDDFVKLLESLGGPSAPGINSHLKAATIEKKLIEFVGEIAWKSIATIFAMAVQSDSNASIEHKRLAVAILQRLLKLDQPSSAAIRGARMDMSVIALCRLQRSLGTPPTILQEDLESWLSVPMTGFTQSPHASCMTPTALIQFPSLWLSLAEECDYRIPTVCQHVVDYCRSIQVEVRNAGNSNGNILDLISDTTPEIIFAGLRHADFVRQTSQQDAETIELQVLDWFHALQNQSLSASAGEATGNPRISALDIVLTNGNWPFAEVRSSNSFCFEGEQPGTLCAGTYATPLISLPAGDSNLSFFPKTKSVPGNRTTADDSRFSFGSQIPNEAVSMHIFIDRKDTLRVWLIRHYDQNRKILSRFVRSNGAYSRILKALLQHDLAIESIWIKSQLRGSQVSISLEQIDTLLYLLDLVDDEDYAHEEMKTQEQRLEVESRVVSCVNELKSTFPRLVEIANSAAMTLFADLSDYELSIDYRKLAGFFSTLRNHLELIQNSRICRSGSDVSDESRRNELNAATKTMVDQVASDLDLNSAWNETNKDVDWQSTPIIVFPQLNLFGIPFSLLPFGGRPLYRQVASIVQAVPTRGAVTSTSQARSHLVNRKVSVVAAYGPNILNGDFKSIPGFLRLHDSLIDATRDCNGTIFGLENAPVASTDTIAYAIDQLKTEDCNLLIVGGHGSEDTGGVILRHDQWLGQGANLSKVDLVMIAACTVGRLKQSGFRSVEGLFANLIKQGCDVAILATWAVSDIETSVYFAEFVRTITTNSDSKQDTKIFSFAKYLNTLRKDLIDHGLLSEHVAGAFEILCRI